MSRIIKLLSAGAVEPGLVKVVEAFRRETGNDVNVVFATAPAIRKRLGEGDAGDVVIAPTDLLDELVKAGNAQAAERVIVGRIGVGVMVRGGAPLPKIATVDEFKQSLLNAESIVHNQASTGIYLQSLFERLGIAEQLAAKTTRYHGHHRSGSQRVEVRRTAAVGDSKLYDLRRRSRDGQRGPACGAGTGPLPY